MTMSVKSTAFMQAFGYKDLDDGGDGLYVAPDYDMSTEKALHLKSVLSGGL